MYVRERPRCTHVSTEIALLDAAEAKIEEGALDIGEVYDDGSVAFDQANDVVVDEVSVQAEESAFPQQGRRSSRSTAGRRKTAYFGR